MANERKTITEDVVDFIEKSIAAHTYLPGSKLPSVRALADRLSISTSTVVEAYARLGAKGIVQSRRGSGFFVCGVMPPLKLAEISPALQREVDPLWVSRQSLEPNTDLLRPGCGWLPSDWMCIDEISKALRSIAKSGGETLVGYESPAGYEALRRLLAQRLTLRNIATSVDQLVTLDSATQALDLLCRFFLKPGDSIIVDDPCYYNFLALLRAHKVKVIGVPYEKDGPDLDRFEEALKQHAPRLYITNSGIHNPTAAALSPSKAHRLLSLADAADLIIIEDDVFADFELLPACRLASLDGLRRVIQIGSFSKTVSASARCGYIACSRAWIDDLIDLKIASNFGSSKLSSVLLFNVLSGSGYRKNIENIQQRLVPARERLLDHLEQLKITPWIIPNAGMFIWGQLPEGHDAAAVARSCLKENVVIAPGNIFSSSHVFSQYIRFNAAQCSNPKIFEVLAKAMK